MLNSVKIDTNVQGFSFSTCMTTLELHGKNLYGEISRGHTKSCQ